MVTGIALSQKKIPRVNSLTAGLEGFPEGD